MADLATEFDEAGRRGMTTRGTTNTNVRGSSYDRRARRQFLLDTYGDGTQASCYRCQLPLTDDTITVDRIVPGCEGGRYVRSNIRPACADCNTETGSALGVQRRRNAQT